MENTIPYEIIKQTNVETTDGQGFRVTHPASLVAAVPNCEYLEKVCFRLDTSKLFDTISVSLFVGEETINAGTENLNKLVRVGASGRMSMARHDENKVTNVVQRVQLEVPFNIVVTGKLCVFDLAMTGSGSCCQLMVIGRRVLVAQLTPCHTDKDYKALISERWSPHMRTTKMIKLLGAVTEAIKNTELNICFAQIVTDEVSPHQLYTFFSRAKVNPDLALSVLTLMLHTDNNIDKIDSVLQRDLIERVHAQVSSSSLKRFFVTLSEKNLQKILQLQAFPVLQTLAREFPRLFLNKTLESYKNAFLVQYYSDSKLRLTSLGLLALVTPNGMLRSNQNPEAISLTTLTLLHLYVIVFSCKDIVAFKQYHCEGLDYLYRDAMTSWLLLKQRSSKATRWILDSTAISLYLMAHSAYRYDQFVSKPRGLNSGINESVIESVMKLIQSDNTLEQLISHIKQDPLKFTLDARNLFVSFSKFGMKYLSSCFDKAGFPVNLEECGFYDNQFINLVSLALRDQPQLTSFYQEKLTDYIDYLAQMFRSRKQCSKSLEDLYSQMSPKEEEEPECVREVTPLTTHLRTDQETTPPKPDGIETDIFGISLLSNQAIQKQQTCDFCGYVVCSDMESHWINECPLMIECTACKSMVEVSQTNDHLANACVKSDSYTQCFMCELAVLRGQFSQHKQQCASKTKSGLVRCYFCQELVEVDNFDSNESWKSHLLHPISTCKPRNVKLHTNALTDTHHVMW